MTFILSFSIIGVFSALFLGVLFLSSRKGNLISNRFLGMFFLLLAVRLGKLFAQEYAPGFLLDIYFNFTQSAFLAMGPVIWVYIHTYLSPKIFDINNKFIHFIPPSIALIGAFYLRQICGEFVWNFIYWGIQIHPLLYVLLAVKTLKESWDFKNLAVNQFVWLYSLLSAVAFIVLINILYFMIDFPFYLVTALLVIITGYLICFLAFDNRTNVLIGISDQKYQNFNLDFDETNQIHGKINNLLIDEELYLDDQLKLADIAGKLEEPAHIISRVINEISGKTFPQYVKSLRIEKAKEKLITENDKKVIAIAFESGFHSLSSFNRVFKKNLGMSPSKYRIKKSTKNAT